MDASESLSPHSPTALPPQTDPCFEPSVLQPPARSTLVSERLAPLIEVRRHHLPRRDVRQLPLLRGIRRAPDGGSAGRPRRRHVWPSSRAVRLEPQLNTWVGPKWGRTLATKAQSMLPQAAPNTDSSKAHPHGQQLTHPTHHKDLTRKKTLLRSSQQMLTQPMSKLEVSRRLTKGLNGCPPTPNGKSA